MRVLRSISLKAVAVIATALAAVTMLFPSGAASASTTTTKSNVAPIVDGADPYGWVSYFRNLAGLAGVSRNTTLEAGVSAHVQYLANHAQGCETDVHNELTSAQGSCPANPYATAAGKAAANNSDITRISINSTPRTAVSNWFTAAFHALVLLDPKLQSTGYASYFTASPLGSAPLAWPFTAGVDVYRGRTGSYNGQTIAFPANGAASPLTTYRVGTESPEPFRSTSTSSACHAWGSYTNVSAPVIMQWPIGANVNMSGQLVDLSTGQALPTCTLTAASYPAGSVSRIFLSGPNGYTKGAFYYASTPFATGHRYALKTGGVTATTFTISNLPSSPGTSAASGYGAVTLKWGTASAGTGIVSGYGVRVYATTNCSGTPVKAGTATSSMRGVTYTGMTHGHTYSGFVFAINSIGAARRGSCVVVKAS